MSLLTKLKTKPTIATMAEIQNTTFVGGLICIFFLSSYSFICGVMVYVMEWFVRPSHCILHTKVKKSSIVVIVGSISTYFSAKGPNLVRLCDKGALAD
jgi:hypothetical protein